MEKKRIGKLLIVVGITLGIGYNISHVHLSVKAEGAAVTYEPTVIPSKKQYTVRFTAEKGGKLSGQQVVKVEENERVKTVPKLVITSGYTFRGWYIGTKKVDPKTTNIVRDTTFVAKFKKSAVIPKPTVKYQAMYRLYNKNTGEHFYTESIFERDSLVKGGWNNEGTGWVAPNKGTAVYRIYNPNAKGGDHYYTTSKYEATTLVKDGWKWDNHSKAVFYSGGKTRVYVAFNPHARSGAHNYTSSLFEQNTLLNNGWKFGKVQFYGK